MSNKKIDINPDLFNIGGSSKTRKKREKKQKPTNVPLISPNVLKNKLLKRIKEHKIKETENLENNKKKIPEINGVGIGGSTTNKTNVTDLGNYTDEFNDSINYLQTLSKQKKVDEQKDIFEKNKQKRKEELERKTVKNYQSILSSPTNLPIVNIELPEELKEQLITVNTPPQINYTAEPITLTSYPVDELPYGCLKNGIKPTYKVWNKTYKNMSDTSSSITIAQPNLQLEVKPNVSLLESNIINQNNERENRLNNLKNKIKEKQNIIDKGNNFTPVVINVPDAPVTQDVIIHNNPTNNIMVSEIPQIPTKTFIKKTICRRYTLGKSKIKKSIGVLIKDRGTRKQVLSAHRDLKKKSINDIKSYLKDHNLIKIGSTAPNDVIRKLYESSMLAGEITNSNTDTLIHNLMKDDKEL
jgi:hypothetical protein